MKSGLVRCGVVLMTFLCVACSDRDKSNEVEEFTVLKIDNSTVDKDARKGKLVPVILDYAHVSNQYKGNLQIVNLTLRAQAGTLDDKAATALFIAENLAKLGNDMIEVYIDRDDLNGVEATSTFKHLVHVSYAPDLKRTFGYEKTWGIRLADHVVSVEMIKATNEYYDQYDALEKAGLDSDKADTKAGQIIAKKYKLPGNWRIPTGNLLNTDLERKNFFINDDAKALESVKEINTCLKGKSNVELTSCGSAKLEILSSDIELVQAIYSRVRDIENNAIELQKKVMSDVVRIAAKKNMTTAEKAAWLREQLQEINETLDKSNHVVVPDMVNADAKRYLAEAIDSHKKWALTQQAKLGFVTKGNLDAAKEMGAQADRLALQEALSMSLAFKSVGAKVP